MLILEAGLYFVFFVFVLNFNVSCTASNKGNFNILIKTNIKSKIYKIKILEKELYISAI